MKTVHVLLLFVVSIAIASAQHLRGGDIPASVTNAEEHRDLKKKSGSKKAKEAKKKAATKKKTGAASGSFLDLRNYRQQVDDPMLVGLIPDTYERAIVAAASFSDSDLGTTKGTLEDMAKNYFTSNGMFFFGGSVFENKLFSCVSKNYLEEIAIGTSGNQYALTDTMKDKLNGTA